MKRRWAALVAAVWMGAASDAFADVSMPSVFGDHMVLQRGGTIPIYGKASPGEVVKVQFAGQTGQTTAKADGAWRIDLAAVEGPGPFELVVEGNNRLSFSDVLVGEVWVCSGQSNMEWSVRNSNNPDEEIAGANHPRIRLFRVPKVRANEPKDDVEATWEVCSPETVANFSAVGYFFGRTLQRDLNVPVGLIQSAWGGTHAEAWTPRETLVQQPGGPEAIANDAVDPDVKHREQFVPQFTAWLERTGRVDAGLPADLETWASGGGDGWKPATRPADLVEPFANFDGVAWAVRRFDLPENLAGQELTLHLGPIDDVDVVFVNGQQVGQTTIQTPDHYSRPRRYTVPAALLKPAGNVVAIRVTDFAGAGGITSKPEDRWMGTNPQMAVLLGEGWSLKPEQTFAVRDDSPAPQRPGGGIMSTQLYNAMIHPLVPYGIRGALWYQGESNAGKADRYRDLMAAMIGSWRQRWGRGDFPFYIVQLADYMSDKDDPAVSPPWAHLREAQRQITLTVPNTALAAAIDIGDPKDIHPRNKQEVGRRLALQALRNVYGKEIVASGPTLESVRREGASLVVEFDHVGSGLVARGESLEKNFVIAGDDDVWHFAEATIDGDTVVLRHPNVAEPTKVRFGWRNDPTLTLYNREGLPAVPFEASAR
jgi:sialate O-acetylesterase